MANIALTAALDKKYAKKFPNTNLLLSGIYRKTVENAIGDITIGYKPRICQTVLNLGPDLTTVLLERRNALRHRRRGHRRHQEMDKDPLLC